MGTSFGQFGNYMDFSGLFFQNNNWNPGSFAGNGFWNTPFWGNNVSISSNSNGNTKKPTTYEEYKQQRLKEQEKAQQEYENRVAESNFRQEQYAELQKTRDLIAINDEAINELSKKKNNKDNIVVDATKLQGPTYDEEGNLVKPAKKKKSWWEKGLEWGSSLVEAGKNIGKSLIGYDENGKWSFKKLATNVVTVAAVVGATCIPVVGPAIGYGLAALSLGAAAKGIYDGSKQLEKATTPQQKEKARQNICSNGIVGALSVFGLRGLGSGVSASAKAAGVTNAASKGISSVAKVRNGLGKPIEGTSQFLRDTFVNSFRATKNAMNADKTMIATKGGGMSGFFKAWGGNIKSTFKLSNSYKTKYDTQFSEMESSLVQKQADLSTRIATEGNASKRALLQEELNMVERNLQELRSLGTTVKTKADYDKLRTSNSATKNQERLDGYAEVSRGVEINGNPISTRRFEPFRKRMVKEQDAYQKQLKSLIDNKESYMRTYARKPNAHRSELNEYTQKTLRTRYNTPEKLKARKTSLQKKINDYEEKLVKLEDRLEKTTKRNKRANLEREIDSYKTLKTNAEKELDVCNTIKFPHWYKPSTWGKNDYQLAIGGHNKGVKSTLGTVINSPKTGPISAFANLDRPYSTPMFSLELAELTPEQTVEYLRELEAEKQSLESTLSTLEGIKDANEWNTLKANLQAQAEAQAQAQAQAQANVQA